MASGTLVPTARKVMPRTVASMFHVQPMNDTRMTSTKHRPPIHTMHMKKVRKYRFGHLSVWGMVMVKSPSQGALRMYQSQPTQHLTLSSLQVGGKSHKPSSSSSSSPPSPSPSPSAFPSPSPPSPSALGVSFSAPAPASASAS